MLKKLFGQAAIYGLAAQISKVAGIFALPFITPFLTIQDYGIMGIIGAYTGVIITFKHLGLNVIASNSFYHHRNHYTWVWRQMYGFLYWWYIPFYFFFGLLLYFIIPDAAIAYRTEIILLTLISGVLFGPATFLGPLYYQLNQNPTPIAIRSAIFSFFAVGLNVYFIASLNMGFRGWIYSGAIISVVTNFSYWYPLKFKYNIKPIYDFRWRHWKRRFKIAIPLIPHYYSSYLLNSSDQMVMERLNIDNTSIGRYNFPARFGGYFGTLTTAFTKALGPMLMEAYKAEEEDKAKYLVFSFQLLLFVCTFSFSLWVKEIFQLLINNPSLEATYLLAIPIIMGYNYRGMYVGANQRLFLYERTKVLWKVTFAAGLSNVVLNIILIPIYGVKIAAVTTFISLMYMGYAGFYLKDYKELTDQKYYPLLWLGSTILITLIAYYAVDQDLSYKILIHLLFFVMIGIVFLVLKKSLHR